MKTINRSYCLNESVIPMPPFSAMRFVFRENGKQTAGGLILKEHRRYDFTSIHS